MIEGINIEEHKAFAAIVGKNDDNLYSTKLIIEKIKHICWHTIDNFTREITAEFKQMGIEVLSSPNEDIITDIVHGSPIKRKVRFFYELKDTSGFIWTHLADKKGPLIYFWDFTYANTDTFNLISPEKRNQIVKLLQNSLFPRYITFIQTTNDFIYELFGSY